MTHPGPNRRDFLATAGAAMGGAWLFGLDPAIEAARDWARQVAGQNVPYETFTQAEGDDFEAFSSRIIPSDGTPGAVEAGCVHFADRALGSFMSDLLPIVRPGLARMNEVVAEMYSGESRLSELTPEQQDAVVGRMENEPGPFFFLARSLVAIGFIGNPSYGGNQNRIGWNHLGFVPQFSWQPPFGYYDRNEHGEQSPDSDSGASSHQHSGGGK